MEFNLDKCVCMHVGTNNKNFNYNIGGVKIKAVEKEKDLGVITNKGFTFTEHIAICSVNVKPLFVITFYVYWTYCNMFSKRKTFICYNT